MDTDSEPALAPGGTVEPANRAAVAKETFQTPAPASRERFELRDPFAEVTYRANTFDDMVAKAESVQATRFHAIQPDGAKSLVRKIGALWHREGHGDRPQLVAAPKPPGLDATPPASRAGDTPAVEQTVAKIDAEAERSARVARLEAALTERYIIKRAPIKIGEVPLGQTEYRYRGDANRVAFTETTFRLATDNNNPSVARSMVDVAEARNWQGIRVTGHEDFKRLVWLEASLRGVRTVGYQPQPGDNELLRRERESRSVNRIEPANDQRPRAHDPNAKQSARGSGGRKAVLAAIEAVLVAKRVPERQREAVMTAAAESLAQRLRQGQTLKVKLLDKSAPAQRTIASPKPERQLNREPATHTR